MWKFYRIIDDIYRKGDAMVNKTTQVLVFLLIQLVIGCLASSNETSHFDDLKIASFSVSDLQYVAVNFEQN